MQAPLLPFRKIKTLFTTLLTAYILELFKQDIRIHLSYATRANYMDGATLHQTLVTRA